MEARFQPFEIVAEALREGGRPPEFPGLFLMTGAAPVPGISIDRSISLCGTVAIAI